MTMLPLYFLLALIPPSPAHPERLPLPPALADADDLSGIYHVEGRHGKRPYVGACVVSRLGATYLFVWTSAGQTTSTTGIGFRDGDRVQVGWVAEKMRGVTSYRLQGGGVLAGRWVTMAGSVTDGEVHRETLTLLRRLPAGE